MVPTSALVAVKVKVAVPLAPSLSICQNRTTTFALLSAPLLAYRFVTKTGVVG